MTEGSVPSFPYALWDLSFDLQRLNMAAVHTGVESG